MCSKQMHLRAATESTHEEVLTCKPGQVGATEMLQQHQNCMGEHSSGRIGNTHAAAPIEGSKDVEKQDMKGEDPVECPAQHSHEKQL